MALKALESDLFSHVVSFLNLEECAVLMPTCRMMRQKVTELPAWGQAEAQLSARNSFDQCSHCEVPWRSPDHVEERECRQRCFTTEQRDYAWLEANDPRMDRTYPEKTAYVQFGLLYKFHAMCVENLIGLFDLGGLSNSLKYHTFIFWGEQVPWMHAMHDLFESSPRHFHLLIDIVSMGMACWNLVHTNTGGPDWYREWFKGSYENPCDGSSFGNEFHEEMEAIYDLATEHQVEFGSDEHIRTCSLAKEEERKSKEAVAWKREWQMGESRLGVPVSQSQQNGLERLGTRLLHKVCPLRMLRDTMEQILGRCREEQETETSFLSDMESDAEEPFNLFNIPWGTIICFF
jgi:hypothetical protein